MLFFYSTFYIPSMIISNRNDRRASFSLSLVGMKEEEKKEKKSMRE